MTGTVKNLMGKKWFGFITSGSKDYFFHKDDFNGDWTQLQIMAEGGATVKVEFDEKHSPKGPRAANVRLV